MMMSSCKMNSSMMNNVSRTSGQAANNQAKPAQTTPAQSDVAVQATIGSSVQTTTTAEAANLVKVYSPAGSVSQNAPAQAQIGLNLNQLA